MERCGVVLKCAGLLTVCVCVCVFVFVFVCVCVCVCVIQVAYGLEDEYADADMPRARGLVKDVQDPSLRKTVAR